MTDDDGLDRRSRFDEDGRERVLVVVLAVAGLVSTVVLAWVPSLVGAVAGGSGVVVGASSAAGYLAMISLAVRPPMRWSPVFRVAWIVVGVCVAVALWSVFSPGEDSVASFTAAMAGLMAGVVLIAGRAVRRR
ncbi:rhomboid family intramembrane serine protease [Gordonia aurantiaca]|uniref:rhomboid family intramembrane serine protease n=1 Tax=Gordonia sp. B21 TaxID=3151852 RepID=UPI0032661582